MAGCSKSDMKIHISTTSMIAVHKPQAPKLDAAISVLSWFQKQLAFPAVQPFLAKTYRPSGIDSDGPLGGLGVVPEWMKVIGGNEEREQQAHKRKDTKQNNDRPTTPKCTHTHTHTHHYMKVCFRKWLLQVGSR